MKITDLTDVKGDYRKRAGQLVVVNNEGTGITFKSVREVTSSNQAITNRSDPTYIADDDVRSIKDEGVRSAVYRVTENIKRILVPFDEAVFGTGGLGGIVGPAGPEGAPGPPGPAGAAGTSVAGTSFVREFICDNSVQLDRAVFLDGDNYVAQVFNNNPTSPIIGIVIGRPEVDKALVQTQGFVPFAIGRGTLWLGADGLISLTPPTEGFIQRLGYSVGDGTISFLPDMNRWLKVT
jgi:hypothetical protein